jgi:hypothetical protein
MLDKEKYYGDWKNDVRAGYGEQVYLNGVVYQGNWEDDVPRMSREPHLCDTERQHRTEQALLTTLRDWYRRTRSSNI